MKMNEFVGIDHPSDKIVVAPFMAKRMLENPEEIDTDAFLYALKDILSSLAPIASERALDKKFGIIPVWDKHPMFGINCDECKDKWAVAYQENAQLADKIFSILIERANYLVLECST